MNVGVWVDNQQAWGGNQAFTLGVAVVFWVLFASFVLAFVAFFLMRAGLGLPLTAILVVFIFFGCCPLYTPFTWAKGATKSMASSRILLDFPMASSRILLDFPPFRTLLKTWGKSGKLLQPKHFGLGQHSADFVFELNIDLGD